MLMTVGKLTDFLAESDPSKGKDSHESQEQEEDAEEEEDWERDSFCAPVLLRLTAFYEAMQSLDDVAAF